jgi:hypothetical protein
LVFLSYQHSVNCSPAKREGLRIFLKFAKAEIVGKAANLNDWRSFQPGATPTNVMQWFSSSPLLLLSLPLAEALSVIYRPLRSPGMFNRLNIRLIMMAILARSRNDARQRQQ